MSWTTFQPHGSLSTIEDFSKQYSRTLKNYSKRLRDYSNYYSRLQHARGLVEHTPRVLMKGRKKTDTY
jgi:CRISPR/Cas system-associated protein Cas10 (large subunit of type III CRISPR-Cas system)